MDETDLNTTTEVARLLLERDRTLPTKKEVMAAVVYAQTAVVNMRYILTQAVVRSGPEDRMTVAERFVYL